MLGNGAPGVSARARRSRAVEEVAAKTLPPGYTIAWTGQAFQEKRIGRASIIAFSFAIVMVFLILAAQLRALVAAGRGAARRCRSRCSARSLAVLLRGMSNDIYFQIGLVVLIGLAAKNAILIVEFAAQEHGRGHGASRRGARGRAAALPADRDDLARVRARRAAARARDRRRRRRAPLDGHRRVRRHARGDVHRHRLHPAVLRRAVARRKKPR